MNTVKWELEDLAFATLYPKRYDEIARLVEPALTAQGPAAPGGHREPLRRPARGADQGHRHRPAEALLLDLPEDDRPQRRVRRHLRPGWHPRPRGHGAGLLRRARHHSRAVESGARPVQGLHRDAEVQHVPVAAHDGHRPRRQAGRAADPHLRHAQARGVRRRRALEVQGRDARPRPGAGQRQREGGRQGDQLQDRGQGEPGRRGDGLAPPAGRLAAGDRGPGRVPRLAPLRPGRRRGLRLHAARRGDRAAAGRHPRRLRVCDPHRRRPPHDRRARQRPPRRPRVGAGQRRHGGDLHLQVAGGGPEPRLAQLRQERPRAQQDQAVVLQGAPRGGGRGGQGPDR